MNNLLELQKSLSERELALFNAEMARHHRSLGVGYVLLVFLGWLGAHKMYLGKVRAAFLYASLSLLGWTFLLIPLLYAEYTRSKDPYGLTQPWRSVPWFLDDMVILGYVCLVFVGLIVVWDLFTLPRQFQQREDEIRASILAQLTSSNKGSLDQ